MQTFLPYKSFHASAQALDYRRLGKQRVEARQILKALATGGGWSNHPATKMWRGCESALILYSNICIKEWISRGYNNTMKILEQPELILPQWLGDLDFHSAHRAALLHKDFDYYRKFDWSEEPALNYIWPTT